MAENENIKFRKPHMTFVNGYFYMLDDDTDMLLAKTGDGLTSFSYPFDTLMSDTVLSCEHDGVNFWSLTDGTVEDTVHINRWAIENYICKLKDTFVVAANYHKFNSNSFSVEHYHCTISGSYNPGDDVIYLKDYNQSSEFTSGMTVTIGPNSIGKYETINVQDFSNGVITLTDQIENSYEDANLLQFYNYIWLFNDYYGEDGSTGCLYKLSAYSGAISQTFPGGAYKDIKASTFSDIDHFSEHGRVSSLMYIKASNLLFVNVHDQYLSYYGSMSMDTIEDDEVTVIPVYDVAVDDKNVYRLQKKATYYGETEDWDNYSYQPATFNSMVASMALNADPNIIAANNVSTSSIEARVTDQFGQPIEGRLVYFEEDDTEGNIVEGQTTVNTDENGIAHSTYTAGVSAKLVKITARVDQV